VDALACCGLPFSRGYCCRKAQRSQAQESQYRFGIGEWYDRSFASLTPEERLSSAALDVGNDRTGRKSRNTFHTARHDLRTSVIPQSEHSLLAAAGQGNPSSSAEFLTSMTSQLFGMEVVYDLESGTCQRGVKKRSRQTIEICSFLPRLAP